MQLCPSIVSPVNNGRNEIRPPRSIKSVNFEGSAGTMEPQGTLQLFKLSLDYNLRYTKLISDGDSKTHTLLLEEKPYGSTLMEKCDCVGHVQKRMGTALCNLKTNWWPSVRSTTTSSLFQKL